MNVETVKRVGLVYGSYTRIILGNADQGILKDYDKLKIEDVNPDTCELTNVIPYYGEVRRFIEVYTCQTVQATIEINRSNTVFRLEDEVKTQLKPFGEIGGVKVTNANIGEADLRRLRVLAVF